MGGAVKVDGYIRVGFNKCRCRDLKRNEIVKNDKVVLRVHKMFQI